MAVSVTATPASSSSTATPDSDVSPWAQPSGGHCYRNGTALVDDAVGFSRRVTNGPSIAYFLICGNVRYHMGHIDGFRVPGAVARPSRGRRWRSSQLRRRAATTSATVCPRRRVRWMSSEEDKRAKRSQIVSTINARLTESGERDQYACVDRRARCRTLSSFVG